MWLRGNKPTEIRLWYELRNAASSGRIVGLVVEIARDGERVYRHASRVADHEAGRAMRVDALFRSTFLTKVATSRHLRS